MRELRQQECERVAGGYQSLVEVGLPSSGLQPLNLPLDIVIGGSPVIALPGPGIIPGPGVPRRRES